MTECKYDLFYQFVFLEDKSLLSDFLGKCGSVHGHGGSFLEAAAQTCS